MKVKNVSQIIHVQAGNVVPGSPLPKAPGETDENFQARLHRMTDKDFDKNVDPQYLANLQRLGAETLYHMVPATLTLGNLLFDLFTVTTKQPTAPVAQALLARRAQRFADALQGESFDLDESTVAQLREGIEKDELWDACPITLFTEVKGERVYFQVKSFAAASFPEVMKAAIDIFVPSEPL